MSTHTAGANYWGRLINPDKSPAPLLEQLCLGIAQLMFTFDDCGTTDLTPERLATFYQKVGGNYDTLFLETKHPSLSFIYQSLGCFHSLQPSTNAFEPPSVPALLPTGFVRWQTIQLLMDPDEHSLYLQNAVEVWDIKNPKGGRFPKTIPRDAFPSEPDPEMMDWHENVGKRLEYDYMKRNTPRSSPLEDRSFHDQFPSPEPPKEEERSRHRATPRHRHIDPDAVPARPRYQRHKSAEFPQFSSRRPDLASFSHPADFKSDFASPSAPSPPLSPPDRHSKTRRERASSFAHPSPAAEPGAYVSDASSEDSGSSGKRRTEKRNSRNRHLSPPSGSRARRHSHEAYARKPEREMSPEPYRRYRHRDEYRPSSGRNASDSGRKTRSSRVYSDEMPHPGPSNMRFRDYVFDDPGTAPPSPEPMYAQVHPRYVNGLNGNYMARPRTHVDPVAEDVRRASYSGPIPNRSNSERARPGNPGAGSRSPRWIHPVPVSAKRCVPVTMAEMDYPPSGRRSAMYDR